MWHKYEVVIQIRDRIVGGIPKNPEMIKAWLAARGLEDLEEQTKKEMADQLTEGSWQGFKRDADGLYIEARQVKASWKMAANVIRKVIKFKGPMRARLAERLFITPRLIHLGVQEASGFYEQTIHVIGPRGPRNAIKRCDYVTAPKLEYAIWILDDGMFKKKNLEPLLLYAQEMGLGADRSQGEGQFDVVRFECVGAFETIGGEPIEAED